jgi:hypothetical protein
VEPQDVEKYGKANAVIFYQSKAPVPSPDCLRPASRSASSTAFNTAIYKEER